MRWFSDSTRSLVLEESDSSAQGIQMDPVGEELRIHSLEPSGTHLFARQTEE